MYVETLGDRSTSVGTGCVATTGTKVGCVFVTLIKTNLLVILAQKLVVDLPRNNLLVVYFPRRTLLEKKVLYRLGTPVSTGYMPGMGLPVLCLRAGTK